MFWSAVSTLFLIGIAAWCLASGPGSLVRWLRDNGSRRQRPWGDAWPMDEEAAVRILKRQYVDEKLTVEQLEDRVAAALDGSPSREGVAARLNRLDQSMKTDFWAPRVPDGPKPVPRLDEQTLLAQLDLPDDWQQQEGWRVYEAVTRRSTESEER